jgi:hypothetical protein
MITTVRTPARDQQVRGRIDQLNQRLDLDAAQSSTVHKV